MLLKYSCCTLVLNIYYFMGAMLMALQNVSLSADSLHRIFDIICVDPMYFSTIMLTQMAKISDHQRPE